MATTTEIRAAVWRHRGDVAAALDTLVPPPLDFLSEDRAATRETDRQVEALRPEVEAAAAEYRAAGPDAEGEDVEQVAHSCWVHGIVTYEAVAALTGREAPSYGLVKAVDAKWVGIADLRDA